MRELVHDLKTNTFEYVDFIAANTWSTAPHQHDYQLIRPADFIDHTSPTNRHTSLRREALRNLIVSYDISDASSSSPIAPCDQLYRLTRRHGDFAPHMVRAFTNILERKDFHTAMSMIQDADERLRKNGIRYSRTDEEIIELAKAKAKAFAKLLCVIPDIEARFAKAESLLSTLGLSFRESLVKQMRNTGQLESLCNRACCDKWLRRQLRRAYFAEVEAVARDLLLVNSRENPYCSAHSVNVMKGRRLDSEQALINTVCYQEDNPEVWFTLNELAAKSTSNPVIRRAEMFVRLKAFEDICKEYGHVAMFYTITAPSRFHVYKGDKVNPKWEKAGKPDALAAHHHLMGVMDAFRKELDKADIKIYGLRIVEPHIDGTPHNHALFFMRPEDASNVSRILRNHALCDSPTESGAAKYRFKAEKIDFSKGSAVGYVAKYLSKNIDGQHIDKDVHTDKSGKDTAQSVVSFNRINGVRQFQFYGGPSVTAWREMRRFREEFKEDDAVIAGNQFTQDEHFVLETLRRAADDGDFKRFVMAMGGVFVKRKEQTLTTAYVKKINVDGLFKQTRYGDEMSAAIHGLVFRGKTIPTRFKDWKFASKKNFIRGVRTMMKGATIIFDTLEDEFEYHAMMQDEYERLAQEAAFYMDIAAMEPTVMFDDGFYAEGAPPPDWGWGWAQPDPDTDSGGAWTCVTNCRNHLNH
ncbi:replication endonuclease [Vibrio fluvialis]|uniref:replication endonuclease n=1 Tax=Vibrio fluvialis TaxID=676 RepID=UPI001EEA952B|nr:replication endonuclease [Vibrio fluvialis]MCG6359118.1 replication endonuclease [Vibrio fluvialis]